MGLRRIWCGAVLMAIVGGGAMWAQEGRSRAANTMMEPTGSLGEDAGGGVEADGPADTRGKLRILFADVEGGQATLWVTPAGKSLLIDTGWPDNGGRDADRIAALAHRAGLRQIDVVLLTHYHVDHAGGVPDLVRKIRVGRFLDHGPNTEAGDADTAKAYAAYRKVAAARKGGRTTVRAGELLPGWGGGGVQATVVSAAGAVLQAPLAGEAAGLGKQNEACERSPKRAAEGSENDHSVGVVVQFGRFRAADLGDLTWGVERGLACPVNELGAMDLLVVSHHGTARSNSPALIAAVQPEVAVMDNGERKGGEAETMQTLAAGANGVGAVWQLHAAASVGPELNTVQERMANRAGEDGNWLEVDASRDGTVEVTNGRTGKVTRYTGGVRPHRN